MERRARRCAPPQDMFVQYPTKRAFLSSPFPARCAAICQDIFLYIYCGRINRMPFQAFSEQIGSITARK